MEQQTKLYFLVINQDSVKKLPVKWKQNGVFWRNMILMKIHIGNV